MNWLVKCGKRLSLLSPKRCSSTLRHVSKHTSIDEKNEDFISRIKIVTDEKESSEIVRNIMLKDEAVAVDMEGVQLPKLGMIQVKSEDGRIYLFRTGRNMNLIENGGLKALLESADIVKVMHATTVDCVAAYKHGIKLWNLYDTALAHKVIEYQNNGVSLIWSNTIGFNKVCEVYGQVQNPLKNAFQGKLYLRENAFVDHKVLNDDLIFYSAYDVEPLLDVYRLTKSMIKPDYQPVFQKLCEAEIIKSIDPENWRAVRKNIHESNQSDVFIYGYDKDLTKSHIYSVLAKFPGYKDVLTNDELGCSHVIMSNRANAILLYDTLSDGKEELLYPALGKNTDLSLMLKISQEEISSLESDNQKHIDLLKKKDFIVDPKIVKEVMGILLKVKCPVVMEFRLLWEGEDTCFADILVGKSPMFRVEVSKEMINDGGLGDLITSKDVIKIVPRLDTYNVSAVLKACSLNGYDPNNFFDLTAAYKTTEYLEFGQSIYKSTSIYVKDIPQKLGVLASTRLELFLFSYLHLNNELPNFVMDYLRARAKIDSDICANINVSSAKELRKQLREKYETMSIHVQRKDGKKLSIKELKNLLKKWEIERIDSGLGKKIAIVRVGHHLDMKSIIKKLQSEDYNAEPVADVKETPFHKTAKSVNISKLNQILAHHIENLSDTGYFRLIQEGSTTGVSKDNRGCQDVPCMELY